MLTQKLKEVNDSLTHLRTEHGIIYPERQIERLTEQKAISLRMNNQSGANKIQRELEVFSQYVTSHDYYKVQTLFLCTPQHTVLL